MEWFIPEQNVPVRQGDILVSRDPKSGLTSEICLVITADCDIRQRKFGKQLACLRILTVKDYVSDVWAKRKLDKLVKEEKKKFLAQVTKWHSKLLGKESTLTEDALMLWVDRVEPQEICNILNVPENDGSRKKLFRVLTIYREAFKELNGLGNSLVKLVAFKSKLEQADLNVCHKKMLQQAKSETLPDDVFLLPALPLNTDTACVVMLREIFGVSNSSICFRATDAISSEYFLRVCRLEPTYKYAVSQSFGVLYSSIGLPDEYESRCAAAVSAIESFEWV